MIKVKSLEIREIEYSYDKRPKISGIGEQIATVVQGTGCSPQRYENKIEDRTILARSFEALAGVLSYDTKDNPGEKLIALFIKLGYLPN